MRFSVLACDYDGTLAADGAVAPSTVAALERLRSAGRKLVMVTGRELEDLQRVFDRLDLFDRIVAENGGLLYVPDERREVNLAPRPQRAFVEALRRRGVSPLGVGRTIVATRRPHETIVLNAIRSLGLELEIIFNKSAVMVLPAGVNKCTGLHAALRELGVSVHNVVGVGDGENDHAFLGAVEVGVAVENAVGSLKRAADWVTRAARGEGVQELIERILEDDLAFLEPKLARHWIKLGTRRREPRRDVALRPYGTSLLVAGSSKAGKSSLTLGILERLTAAGYQYCLVDPEGDYEAMPGAVNLGTAERVPSVDEVLDVLEPVEQSAVVSLLALPLEDRPRYVAGLLPRLEELRVATARPHWLVVDEAHHIFPAEHGALDQVVPRAFGGLVLIGLGPRTLAASVLPLITTVCAVGQAPAATLREFAELVGERAPSSAPRGDLDKGEAVVWERSRRRAEAIDVEPARGDRKRHRRKYAEGALPPDRSFYFRGPVGRLKLRAQNLSVFLELGEGVDDATWMHHLRAGDYSRWMATELKDKHLAEDVAAIEQADGLSAAQSRTRVRAAVERRYAPPG